MGTASYIPTNKTAMDAGTYPAQIDINFAMLQQWGANFQVTQQSTPSMSVLIGAGWFVGVAGGIQNVAAQNSPTFVAPTSHNRIDLVYVDNVTGVAGVATGVESASPVIPAILTGKSPVAYVTLNPGMTAIGNGNISDYRMFSFLGLGTAAGYNVGVSGATLGLLNADKVDGGNNTFQGINNFTGALQYNGSQVLTGNQSIAFSGDVSGSGTTAIALTLASSGVGPGTYTTANITVDAKGRITSASSGSSNPPAGSVHQGTLSASTGSVSVTGGPTFAGIVTLPGGAYGFFPQLRAGAVSNGTNTSMMCGNATITSTGGGSPFFPQIDGASAIGTSFITNITLFNGTSNVVQSSYAQQTYINASPPYDMGDGEVQGFWFLVLDRSGVARFQYVADVPPWAYNGPTDIRPHYVDPRSGKKFRRRPSRSISIADILRGKATPAEFADAHSAWRTTFDAKREAFRVTVQEIEEKFTGTNDKVEAAALELRQAQHKLAEARVAHGRTVAEIERRHATATGWAKPTLDPFDPTPYEQAIESARAVQEAVLADRTLYANKLWEAHVDTQMNPAFDWYEITHDIKNADMKLIPHPFLSNDLRDHTVVLLDPMNELIGTLIGEMQDGHHVVDLIHDGHLKIDNEALSRKGPAGVIQVKFRF